MLHKDAESGVVGAKDANPVSCISGTLLDLASRLLTDRSI